MRMRHRMIALALFASVGVAVPAVAQVSFGISTPGVSIGFNVPTYPQLVRVPGYPVYYAPGLNANYFFYDGMYWIYQGDNWYTSSWYNGPWNLVAPDYVPAYVLRVPVRYYRAPPVYFRGWRADAPPRWGDHWGGGWSQAHRGWDKLGPQSSSRARAGAVVPATVLGQSVSAAATAILAEQPALPLSAAGSERAPALSAARRATAESGAPGVPITGSSGASRRTHADEPGGWRQARAGTGWLTRQSSSLRASRRRRPRGRRFPFCKRAASRVIIVPVPVHNLRSAPEPMELPCQDRSARSVSSESGSERRSTSPLSARKAGMSPRSAAATATRQSRSQRTPGLAACTPTRLS